MKNYFIYFPDGYKRKDVDHVENVKAVWDLKKEAIRAHKSQNKDGDLILKIMMFLPKEEYFLLKKRLF